MKPSPSDYADLAQANFDAGLNCAQSVLLAFSAEHGMAEAEAKRVASLFGAGMARLQETCGALTGAFMAMGLIRGAVDPQDQAARDRLFADTRGLADSFKAEFGTSLCRDLLGCDLKTPEGQKFHKDQGQRTGICTRCVRASASNLAKLLAERAD